jgi:hypothetical protein
MATRMQQRRGTAAQWTTANPILAAGEIGFETDNNKFKIGDGVNHWADLSYFSDAASISALVDGAPALMDTLNEISAALGDDPDFVNTIGQQISTINNQIADLANISAVEALDNAMQGHNSSVTNVHGILDTAQLVTMTDMGTAISDLDNSLQTSINNLSDGISDHEALTTSVHGITNTQNLVYTADSRLSDERTPVDGSVTTAKIVNSAVETAKIADLNVTTEKLADSSVTNAKMADDAVDTAEIKDGAVTNAKLAGSIAQSKVTNLETDLGNKQDKVSGVSDVEIGYLDGVTSGIQAQLDAKSPIASPTFTGTATTNHLIVDGDFTVNGTNFSASATSITIEDNMVQLAHQNAANTVDLGLVVAYNDGTAKHSGLVRDVSDAKWKLFKDVTTEPSTTVDFTQGSLDDLKVAAFEATTVTPSSGVVFSDGTQTKEGVPSRTPIVQKTASYSLDDLSLRDSIIEVSSTSGTTITVPADSNYNYPVGTTLDILQTNTGQVTIAGDSGVTVNATPGLKLRTQWSSATLLKRAANTWVAFGDLSA